MASFEYYYAFLMDQSLFLKIRRFLTFSFAVFAKNVQGIVWVE